MKKLLLTMLFVTALLLCAACDMQFTGNSKQTFIPAEIVLLADQSDTDNADYDRQIWKSIKSYATENNISYASYHAQEDTPDAYLAQISAAVDKQAKLIFCYGGVTLESAVYQAQTIYPDVNFVLLDGEPHSSDYADYSQEDNVYCVFYAEEQAGFLAGYAAVQEGFVTVGFMGDMAVPATVAYGSGFLQGVDYAAQKMGVQVKVIYHYTRALTATPESQTLAGSWYANGMGCIFACGAASDSVIVAAETAGAKVICCGLDRSEESTAVLTTAIQKVGVSVTDTLEKYAAGEFPGGKVALLGVSEDCVGLEMDNARFNTFNRLAYNIVRVPLKNNEINVQRVTDETFDLSSLLSASVVLEIVE